MPIELVVFDIAGTLIEDHDEVTSAFAAAFERNGIAVSQAELRENKGAGKQEVIRRIVEAHCAHANETLVEQTFADFRRILEKSYLDSLTPIDGATKAIDNLKSTGVKVATNTGFYRTLRDSILERLGWCRRFDCNVCSDDVARGRPAPYQIFRAMEMTGSTDVRRVMAVGDTPLDLQAATNAGAIAVGVLTGVHGEARLAREPHEHLVATVRDVPALLGGYP